MCLFLSSSVFNTDYFIRVVVIVFLQSFNGIRINLSHVTAVYCQELGRPQEGQQACGWSQNTSIASRYAKTRNIPRSTPVVPCVLQRVEVATYPAVVPSSAEEIRVLHLFGEAQTANGTRRVQAVVASKHCLLLDITAEAKAMCFCVLPGLTPSTPLNHVSDKEGHGETRPAPPSGRK